MFNLIMISVDWNIGRETIPISRIFEYTDEHVANLFKGNNSPILDKLIRLPCLFMQEGRNDEIAYVGQINRARIVDQDIVFEYSLDSELPPLYILFSLIRLISKE